MKYAIAIGIALAYALSMTAFALAVFFRILPWFAELPIGLALIAVSWALATWLYIAIVNRIAFGFKGG